MDLLSPAGDWEACGDDNKFYSKVKLYDMGWSGVTFASLRVACASHGGPIAHTRDERQVVVVMGASMKPTIAIFNAAGQPLASVPWEQGSIVGLGWTAEEKLVVVESTGQVSVFSQRGVKDPRSFSLGEECAQDGVLECQIYSNGLVALTKKLALWGISDLTEPRPRKLATPRIDRPPSAMAVIEPRHTLSGTVEVLLACGDSIMVADSDSVHVAAAEVSGVNRLAVAPNGQFVAAFTEDGRLVVWLSDFTKKLSEFSTQSEEPPDSLAWCGIDSVVMAWPDMLLVVRPYGDWINFELEEPVILVQEVDGVRVLGSEKHELLRQVPNSLVEIFKIGSTAPGAMLFDARTMYDQENPKADEVLRGIVETLPEAVKTCVDAAAAELDPLRQSALLKAACYGRAFCPADAFPRKRIVHVCRLLRLVNALRGPEVGMALTMAQLEDVGVPAILRRLIDAGRHLLAFRAAEVLGLGTEQVLMHWACAKMSAAGDLGDGPLMESIAAKLKGRGGVRFTQLASHAQGLGRKRLAALLLDLESSAAEQVPLLLKLGEDERALQRAVESGDTDLVYLVLFSMHRSLPLADFVKAISARPRVRQLFLAYCAQVEPELMQQLCKSMGRYEDLAASKIRQSLGCSNDEGKLRGGTGRRASPLAMSECILCLDQAADLYGQTKEHGFEAKAASEFSRLRKFQADLEEETGNACFVGLSVVGTAQQCVRLGNARAANRVQSEFRLSDRRFWWLKAKVHAASKDWDALLSMALEKKSPVGCEPCINLAKDHGAPDVVTARFIAKLPDSTRKAEEYTALKMYREAAETAAKSRDSDMLSKIQGLVGGTSPLGLAVTQIKDRLQQSGR